MLSLGVGGCSSGVGKTTLICRLLEVLPGWGALKTTPVHRAPCPDSRPCPACRNLHGRYEIVTQPERLYRDGADTARYRAAGGASVAWLKTLPRDLGRGVIAAVRLFQDLPGVAIEGNSFTRYLEPDRMLLVARADLDEVKPTARALLGRADVVVLNRGNADAERVRAWRTRLAERYHARRLVALDLGSPNDPDTRAFVDEIREWAEG